MHYNFIFYFLIFLIYMQSILSTNKSNKVLLEKIDKFHEEFVIKFNELEEKIKENGGLEKIKNEKFTKAMFKKRFPSKIIKAKKEVDKYLKGELTFQVCFNAMNSLKLEFGKLVALDDLIINFEREVTTILNGDPVQKDFLDLKGEHLIQLTKTKNNQIKRRQIYLTRTRTNQIKKQLELVKYLMGMHESVNEFVEEIVAELRINHIKRLLKKVDKHIKVQKTEFVGPYEKFSENCSKEFFPIIENYIKSAKDQLEWKYSKYLEWPNSSIHNVPLELIENRDMLKRAIENSKPFLLEKVILNQSIEWNNSDLNTMQQQLNVQIQISEELNEYVDELPKLSNTNDRLRFGGRIQKYYESLNHSKSLNIACYKMLNLIKHLFNKKANIIEENDYLTDIHFLTTFIEEEFAKMNIPMMAWETEELPEELEINREMDPKEKAILIVKNMLFIVAQMRKCHNFEDAIDETFTANPIDNSKNARIEKLFRKELPTQSFGKFVYQKYLHELEREKSAKRKQNDAGSSSTNMGANKRRKHKKRKTAMN